MTKLNFDRIRQDYPLPDIVSNSGVKLDKDGNEFRACCPFHAEKTASFSVYNEPVKGWKYHCFGCGAHGDVIDYVKERYGYADTAEAVAFFTGEDASRRPLSQAEYKEATNPYDGFDIIKPPATVAEILAGVRTPPILNPKRVNPENGKAKVVTYTPKMVFPYRNKRGELLGYVFRVEFDDKKITPGVWWTVNKAAGFEGWSHGSYPEPRPMYGLDLLAANPDAQVVLVEGEKCADAANRIFKAANVKAVALSWMGGGKSIKKTYWKSLAGRSVVIWPDNDPEGWKTVMGFARPGGGWTKGLVEYLLAAGVARLKIVHITPESRPKGWDIADAEKELPASAIMSIMKERVQIWSAERFELWKVRRVEDTMPQTDQREEVQPPKSEERAPQDEEPERNPEDAEPPAPVEVGRGFQITAETWRQHLIMKADGDGLKASSIQNLTLILQFERRFAGLFGWNEFAKEVYIIRRPPWETDGAHGTWRPRKLNDTDATACAGYLEYTGMSPKVRDVERVIVRVSEFNRYNPVTDALDALVWDGKRRVRGEPGGAKPWIVRYLGADDTRINAEFGEKWLIGAIARAYDPGCKMDTALILEGRQGLKKSTAIKTLADAVAPGLFTDQISDPNSKDAALEMQGAWIIEMAEMDALRRAEVTAIKAWLTRQTDRIRRPYGKVIEEFPRSCILAGTVNPLGNSGYLKDPTGGRRFWPVEAHDIDLQGLKEDARQIWAEAVVMYRLGLKWWLDEDGEALARVAQAKRFEVDPYGELIDECTKDFNRVRLQNIMNALEIPKERRNTIVSRRIMSHLVMTGWTREEQDGKVYYVRANPIAEEEEVPMDF